MTSLVVHLDTEAATREWGQRLGELISEPVVIYLSGTLGAGKTRLVQAIAAGLQIDPDTVQSPTFTLMTPHPGRLMLVHVDAYRINSIDEADQLGLDDWVDSGCVLIVEWAERIESALPNSDLKCNIKHVDKTSRRIAVTADSSVGTALLAKIGQTSGSSHDG